MSDSEDILYRYIQFYEGISLDNLSQLDSLVSPDIRFVDPFNDVVGVQGYRRVLEDMFKRCFEPKFAVEYSIRNEGLAFIKWHFSFRSKLNSPLIEISGVSELCFNKQGLVSAHLDYWDPCSQLYERFWGLGFVLKRIRSYLSAG